jgi:serine protease inhibitor
MSKIIFLVTIPLFLLSVLQCSKKKANNTDVKQDTNLKNNPTPRVKADPPPVKVPEQKPDLTQPKRINLTSSIDKVKNIATGINGIGDSIYKAIAVKLDKDIISIGKDAKKTLASLANAKRNIILSPYSIASAFSLAWAGAKNKTEKELGKFFSSTLPYPEQHKALGTLQIGLDNAKGLKLKIANSLWLEKTMAVRSTYLKNTADWYGAKPYKTDFIMAPKKATNAINRWVEAKTNNRIKNLILPNIIDSSTRAVLVNAIWFLAKWAQPFTKTSTHKADFYPLDTWKISVKTMVHKIYSKMIKFKSGAHFIDLPYKGGRFSFQIYLPPSGKSLTAPTKDELKKIATNSISKSFILYLPKFTLTAPYVLGGIISKMIPLSFSGKADFSGITKSKQGLMISEVIHKTFLKVDEEGTEAAAATALLMKGAGMPAPAPTIRVNRPFMFWIKDNKTGLNLFMGRIINPDPKATLKPHSQPKSKSVIK